MRAFLTFIAALGLAGIAAAQEHVSFPARDGWVISANLYGDSDRAVVLVHGGRFTKESWEQQARQLVKAGFRVLAFDLRGFGQSQAPPQSHASADDQRLDVVAAVRFLRKAGAKKVSVVGGSMGGVAAAEATIECEPDEIDRVVMIAIEGIEKPEKMKGRKLFITCRDDLGSGDKPRLNQIRLHYEQAPEPKELVILEGKAHAQFIFATDQADRLMREIMRFLSAP